MTQILQQARTHNDVLVLTFDETFIPSNAHAVYYFHSRLLAVLSGQRHQCLYTLYPARIQPSSTLAPSTIELPIRPWLPPRTYRLLFTLRPIEATLWVDVRDPDILRSTLVRRTTPRRQQVDQVSLSVRCPTADPVLKSFLFLSWIPSSIFTDKLPSLELTLS